MGASGKLRVFVLNVGQADTSVIVAPSGNVAIIDAVAPAKLGRLLEDLGLTGGARIEHLILTHPHRDHYSGAAKILTAYDVRSVVLSSFEPYTGTPAYQAVIEYIGKRRIPCLFVASHNTFYLEGPLTAGEDCIKLDLVGPSQGVLNELGRVNHLNPNHLSLITRLDFGQFTIVLAADAQMENWQHFDQEGMMGRRSTVLKAAHHGSRHGNQSERLERLRPRHVIVSSDPDGRHELPDLVGAATLYDFCRNDVVVSLTRDTGTVQVAASSNGDFEVSCHGEGPSDPVPLGEAKVLDKGTNPTDWAELVRLRLA